MTSDFGNYFMVLLATALKSTETKSLQITATTYRKDVVILLSAASTWKMAAVFFKIVIS